MALCDRCGTEFDPNRDPVRPGADTSRCPSCGPVHDTPEQDVRGSRVEPLTNGGECSVFGLPAADAPPGAFPRFDADLTVDTQARQGQLVLTLALSEAECEAVWHRIAGGDGHEYPADVHTRVLEAITFDAAVRVSGRGTREGRP